MTLFCSFLLGNWDYNDISRKWNDNKGKKPFNSCYYLVTKCVQCLCSFWCGLQGSTRFKSRKVMKILNWVEYDLSLLKVSKCVKIIYMLVSGNTNKNRYTCQILIHHSAGMSNKHCYKEKKNTPLPFDRS